MIIFVCILLFFIFLLTLRCTLIIEYDEELSLTLRVLFIKIDLLSDKKKKYRHSMSARKAARIRKKLRKKALKQREKDTKKQKEDQLKEKHKKKRTARDILDTVSLITSVAKVVIKKTFGHARLKLTRVNITVATGDAASTAIAYGAVSQSINVLFAVLNEVKRVKLPTEPDDVNVNADFLAQKSDIDVKLSFTLRVWHIIHIACAALIKLIGRTIENEKKKAGN